MVVTAAKFKRIGVGFLVFCFYLMAVPTSPAQVEVDRKTKNLISDAARSAGKLKILEKFPYVGPILSISAALIFSEKEEPSYAQMKAEWEGYTDRKIQQERISRLGKKLEGLQDLVEDVEKTYRDEAEQERGKWVSYHDDKFKGWEFIAKSTVKDLPDFKTRPEEPAAPIMDMLAGVAHLNINALDQLIILKRAWDPKLLAKLRKDRADRMIELNNVLEEHIAKAARERTEKLAVHGDDHCRQISTAGPDNIVSGTDREVFITRCEPEWWVTDQGKRISGVVKSRAVAEGIRAAKANEISKQFVHDARIEYLILDKIVLKVQFIHPTVTYEKFLGMFSRFGKVTNLRGPYLDKGDSFGMGYIEMNYAEGVNAMAYWNSERGQKRAMGIVLSKGFTKELLTSRTQLCKPWVPLVDPRTNLTNHCQDWVVEIRKYDPWNNKWR